MELTQLDMIAILKNSPYQHYKKSGRYYYEVCAVPREVVTKFADENSPEVTNYAEIGDYILTGKVGENYVVKPEVFFKRYTILSSDEDITLAKAKGECWAAKWTVEDTEFDNPPTWDKGKMQIKRGDMLVSPDASFSEVYRVKAEEFARTYELDPQYAKLATQQNNISNIF